MDPAPDFETQKLIGSIRVMLRQCHYAWGLGALLLVGNTVLILSGGSSVPAFGLAGVAMALTGMIGRTAQDILARLELRLRRLESVVEDLRTESKQADA